MAFATITKVKDCLKTISKIYSNYNGQDDCSVKISSVYEETRPKEPEYLFPLREWEKKMGFVTAIRWTSAIPIVIFHLITVLSIAYSIIIGNIPKWQTFLFGTISIT